MKENNSRREFLSQSGKMVTAAALFGPSVPLAHAGVAGTLNCEANNTMKITDRITISITCCWKPVLTTKMAWRCRPARRARLWKFRTVKLLPCARNKQHPDATLPHYDAGGKLMLPLLATCIFISTKPFTADRGAHSIACRHHHPGHD
ncbi:deaminase [Escherichia coli]|uniref:Deaminase n=1 Tax=Escherichia coli TaxID=562 RepID=A0A484VWY5_ECOLX|nr:deaminase [Escherichia coli]